MTLILLISLKERKLIYADTLLRKKTTLYIPSDPENTFDWDWKPEVVFVEDIRNAKAIDAVEVVRCGQCKFRIDREDDTYGCHITMMSNRTLSDFCSRGEKTMVNKDNKVYIDKYQLIKITESSKKNNPHINPKIRQNHNCEHDHFINLIMFSPIEPVREVVFCSECKYWSESTMACLYQDDTHSFADYAPPIWQADDYCSYGERKEIIKEPEKSL